MRVKEPISSVSVLLDATVWGSAKDGLVITNKALYFKNMMEDPVRIELGDLQKVEANGRSMTLNGASFSPGVFNEKVIAEMARILSQLKS